MFAKYPSRYIHVLLTAFLLLCFAGSLFAAGSYRHYLPGGSVMVETIQQETGAGSGPGSTTGTKVLYYGYQDHLGSLVALVRERINGNGSIGRIVADYRSYDAWGRLRDNDDWTLPRTTDLQITDRGYTGHEHLQSFGIINMNGRVYDPLTAQFFSPDPYVQAPGLWLNYNRYAYCLNNPLIYTDPDGEWILGYLSGLIRGIVQGKNPFKTALQTSRNEDRIIAGLYVSDPNKSLQEQIVEIQSRQTDQMPQTMLGLYYALISNLAWQVDEVNYWGGATVSSGNNWGVGEYAAVTIGSYISGGRALKADPNNSLFQHEYGHYLQSQEMGLGFLSRVAIPSLMSTMMFDDGNHKYQPYEQDANRRAFLYFNEHVEGFYRSDASYYGKGWNFYRNPLDVNHIMSYDDYWDYYNKEHIDLINDSLTLHAKRCDYSCWRWSLFGVLGVGILNGINYNINRIK